jgi:hypothetical protein
VKDLTTKTRALLAATPRNENFVTVTAFKTYMMDGKPMKNMAAVECGCQKGCDCELPK